MDPKEFLGVIAGKCPLYRERLPDCPLRVLEPDLDPASLPARIGALPEPEADDLVRRHFLCVCRRNGCGTD